MLLWDMKYCLFLSGKDVRCSFLKMRYSGEYLDMRKMKSEFQGTT